MNRKSIFGITLVTALALTLGNWAHAAAWSDIKAWEPLGSRWAIARDGGGNAIAIYDLSFPAWADPIPLAKVGAQKIDAKAVIKALLGAEKPDSQTKEDADDVVRKLSEEGKDELSESLMPDGWWKQVKWTGNRALGAERPEAFTLRDLDLNAMAKSQKKMKKALANLQQAWNDLAEESPELAGNPLDQLRLVRDRDTQAGYVIFWQPASERGVAKPRKLADLTSTKWAFLEAAKWELIEKSLDQVTSIITVPIATAIIDTALDRFFHFHKLLRRSHENMVLEAIADLEDGNPGDLFPGGALSSADIDRSIESLSYAQSSLTSGWKWIWKKPLEEWKNNLSDGLQYASQNEAWLTSHGFQALDLGTRFAQATDAQGDLQLRLLANAQPKKNGPALAYDSAQPDRNFRSRLAEEALTTAVVFGAKFIPIPFVGTGLKTLYKQLVEKKFDAIKAWEARLTVHLEQLQAIHGENWQVAIQALDHQRVNPLFPSREKEFALIQARKQALGIR